MLKRLARILLVLLGVSLGIALAAVTLTIMEGLGVIDNQNRAWGLVSSIIYTSGMLIGFLLSVIFSGPTLRSIERLVSRTERWVQSVPPGDLLFGSIGVVIGLTIALLINTLFSELIVWIAVPLRIIVFLLLGYVGGYFGSKRWRDLPIRFPAQRRGDAARNDAAEAPGSANKAAAKVLDTSALIDGRVLDIAKTGFLEGELIVPSFVLEELRHIADSADDLRRKRGRRGLDVVAGLQAEPKCELNVLEMPESSGEVDVRLLRLAAEKKAAVITADYNLNKVAQVSGVPVLNINELGNALKAVLLPGENFRVQIVKEGKEHRQGIAYLPDGTMVVVENARAFIGRAMDVVVTSVLQTAAGRMIFAKAADE